MGFVERNLAWHCKASFYLSEGFAHTSLMCRASGARHWLALPVCHAKLAQQPDKAKIEHVHQALIMRLRQSPSVDCWIKAGHSSIARAF